jgi:hypothetical protein
LSVYETLESLKIELPALTKPVAAFVPFTRVGALVFVSCHIAKRNGQPWEGQLGANLTIEQGKEAARGVAIELIATLNKSRMGPERRQTLPEHGLRHRRKPQPGALRCGDRFDRGG